MWRPIFLAITVVGLGFAARADDDVAAALQQIEDRWTAVRYEIKGDPEKLAAVHVLENDNQTLMQAHPAVVEAKVWYALTLLAEADIHHNASALSIVKDARRLLEE